MLGVPDPKARAAAPESLSLVAVQRSATLYLAVAVVVSAAVSLAALAGWWRADHRFATEARLTYVKLSPSGAWAIDRDLGEQVVYFDSTLRQTLYDWIERRYSMVSATIIDDWAIAYAMYSPERQRWFADVYKGTTVAQTHAQCASCPQTRVRVRTHQHLDPLPDAPGVADSPPVRTLVYAHEEQTRGAAHEAGVRKIYRVTWRMLSKAAIQSQPKLLRYNPIGVEILDVEATDDTTHD
jgi:hypothetical protein